MIRLLLTVLAASTLSGCFATAAPRKTGFDQLITSPQGRCWAWDDQRSMNCR